MKIVFWGKGERAVRCFDALIAKKAEISLVVTQPGDENLCARAKKQRILCIQPEDPHQADVISLLKAQKADVFVLGGYGLILKPIILEIPKKMTLNLHAGKLPEFRGSSPMNWALIRGEKHFSISVIQVDSGVDSGPVIAEQSFKIGPNDTILNLHETANEHFPSLLVSAIQKIAKPGAKFRKQDEKKAAYYPLRFSEDGLIVWDLLTAEEIHNRIRALTNPYPNAFTYYHGRRVNLLASELLLRPFYGEPGRIYKISDRGVIVAAKDCALRITRAQFADNGTLLTHLAKRYDCLTTVRDAILKNPLGAAS